GGELPLVPRRRGLDRADQSRLALRALAFLRRGYGQRQPRLARQALHGLGEAQPLAAHHEPDDIAMGAAAEAVKEALLVADGEGRRLLVVEGAEAQALPAAALQLDLARDHRDQR